MILKCDKVTERLFEMVYNEVTKQARENKNALPYEKGKNKMSKNKFYICEKCGNIVEMVNASGVTPHCCGQKMSVLEAGVVEASREKHIPEVEVLDNRVNVTVGTVIHPMSEDHSILWVYLETDKGGQRKELNLGVAPSVSFILCDEKPIAVYAYCNLHGLWKKEI